MIEMIYVFRRLASLSLEECHSHWHGTHASVVRKHAATIGLTGYTQVYRLDDPFNDTLRASRSGDEPYDGFAELRWRDEQDLLKSFENPEAQQAGEDIQKDEIAFIDTGRSSLWLAGEHVVIEGGPGRLGAIREGPMIKLVHFFHRLPGLSLEECQGYWREKHGPLLRKHAAALRVLRYMQVYTLDNPINDALRESHGAMQAYDGLSQLWWKNRDDLETSISTPEGQRAWRELLQDERHFADVSRSSLWLAKDNPVVED